MITSIIFDLGGVLAKVDPERTLAGIGTFVDKKSLNQEAVGVFYKTIALFERGVLGNDEFLNAFDTFLHQQNPLLPPGVPSRQTLVDIWNAMITEFPVENVQLLARIRSHYKVYLLSNTNGLHFEYMERLMPQGFADFGSLFEKVFCSHLLKMSKPDPAIYREVCRQADLIPEDTLFVDDREENLNGARQAGLQARHVQAFNVAEFFTEDGILKEE